MSDHPLVVLFVGKLGSGKSTLCNVTSGSSDFAEGMLATAQTQRYQVNNYQVDAPTGENDQTEALRLRLIDTVGLQDPSRTHKQLLQELADACEHVKPGLNQIFYVIDGRPTPETIQDFERVTSIVFNPTIFPFLTIARTRFSGFRDHDLREADIVALKEIPAFRKAIESSAKVVHVNNMTELEDPNLRSRNDSRTRLLLHLKGCSSVYVPQELSNVRIRIEGLMTEAERLAKEIQEQQARQRELDRQRQEQERERQRLAQQKAEQERRLKEIEAREQALKNASNGSICCSRCRTPLLSTNGGVSFLSNATLNLSGAHTSNVVCTCGSATPIGASILQKMGISFG
eukprot:TRINITY_DN288_c0_g1_i2.p1 TRINITY_DN288_c0_g1~~TRINITY_DN288_c0_g1_i2.p1  ORF type:complete len:345 (+),score=76.14 TRINITY_DN288_c0_g1_i2:97-1131(+)